MYCSSNSRRGSFLQGCPLSEGLASQHPGDVSDLESVGQGRHQCLGIKRKRALSTCLSGCWTPALHSGWTCRRTTGQSTSCTSPPVELITPTLERVRRDILPLIVVASERALSPLPLRPDLLSQVGGTSSASATRAMAPTGLHAEWSGLVAMGLPLVSLPLHRV